MRQGLLLYLIKIKQAIIKYEFILMWNEFDKPSSLDKCTTDSKTILL